MFQANAHLRPFVHQVVPVACICYATGQQGLALRSRVAAAAAAALAEHESVQQVLPPALRPRAEKKAEKKAEKAAARNAEKERQAKEMAAKRVSGATWLKRQCWLGGTGCGCRCLVTASVHGNLTHVPVALALVSLQAEDKVAVMVILFCCL